MDVNTFAYDLLPWSIRLRLSSNVNASLVWLSMNDGEPSMNFALASIQAMAFAFASLLWRPADVRSTHGRHNVCGLHYRSTVRLTTEQVLPQFGGNIGWAPLPGGA